MKPKKPRKNDTKSGSTFTCTPAFSSFYIDKFCAYPRTRTSQKARAAAAATLRESTPWDMGMRTV